MLLREERRVWNGCISLLCLLILDFNFNVNFDFAEWTATNCEERIIGGSVVGSRLRTTNLTVRWKKERVVPQQQEKKRLKDRFLPAG